MATVPASFERGGCGAPAQAGTPVAPATPQGRGDLRHKQGPLGLWGARCVRSLGFQQSWAQTLETKPGLCSDPRCLRSQGRARTTPLVGLWPPAGVRTLSLAPPHRQVRTQKPAWASASPSCPRADPRHELLPPKDLRGRLPVRAERAAPRAPPADATAGCAVPPAAPAGRASLPAPRPPPAPR